MRVALVGRSTLFSSLGGDSIQMLETAKHLSEFGVEAEIILSNQTLDFQKFDLLHFFNIIRPEDILFYTKKTTLPFVVSPIYVDYSYYEQQLAGKRGLLARTIGKHTIEQIKNLARILKKQERLKDWSYWFSGQKKSMEKILQQAKLVLPNSENEMSRLKSDLNFDTPYQIVTNGIDRNKWLTTTIDNENRSGVLCVARIEGLKNQHLVIEACKTLNVPLTLIGNVAPNHASYLEQCKKSDYKGLTILPSMPQEHLVQFYAKAKVHVLASWFETTGLASLEAGLMGCNLVISKLGDAPDYFKTMVEYCHPQSLESIIQAIKRAYEKPTSQELSHYISTNYTWQIAAKQTALAYKTVLQ